MVWRPLLLFAPLVVMLCCAAATDLRTRRIPNGLVLVLLASGVMQSFLPHGTCTPLQSVGGVLVAAVLNLPLFSLGTRGGGDLKLFAGAGAWLGVVLVVQVFLAAAVIGMVLALVQGAAQGRLRALLRNTATAVVGLRHLHSVGTGHILATNGSFAAAGRRLPYAVPILLATVALLVIGREGLL